MKIGNRLACDKCGRLESSKLKIHTNPAESSKHLCEECNKIVYSESFPLIQRES